jgi:AraC-like DNA-binding protein
MAKIGTQRHQFVPIDPDHHLALVKEYAASAITVKELAACYGYNPTTLHRILKGYVFTKPKRPGSGRRMAHIIHKDW